MAGILLQDIIPTSASTSDPIEIGENDFPVRIDIECTEAIVLTISVFSFNNVELPLFDESIEFSISTSVNVCHALKSRVGLALGNKIRFKLAGNPAAPVTVGVRIER